MTLSTYEAEYVALSQTTNEILWLKEFFGELNVEVNNTTILDDNQSVIASVSGTGSNNTFDKHVHIRYKYIEERVSEGLIKIIYVQTLRNVADLFTKPLSRLPFTNHYNHLSFDSNHDKLLELSIKTHTLSEEYNSLTIS